MSGNHSYYLLGAIPVAWADRINAIWAYWGDRGTAGVDVQVDPLNTATWTNFSVRLTTAPGPGTPGEVATHLGIRTFTTPAFRGIIRSAQQAAPPPEQAAFQSWLDTHHPALGTVSIQDTLQQLIMPIDRWVARNMTPNNPNRNVENLTAWQHFLSNPAGDGSIALRECEPEIEGE